MAKKSTQTAAAALAVAMPSAEHVLNMLPDMMRALNDKLVEAFDADFGLATAQTAEEKDALRGKANKAKGEVRQMLAGLGALVDGPVPAAGERTFEATTTIDHAGKRYLDGDPISLDRDSFNQLKEVGAVLGNWDE